MTSTVLANELTEQWINELKDQYSNDLIDAILEVELISWLENNQDLLEDCYLLPDVHDDYTLGEYYADEFYYEDLNKNSILASYFDYEKFGRDIRMENYVAYTSYGALVMY